MIESLIIAGLAGLVVGALMLGTLRAEVKGLRAEAALDRQAVSAVHARLDAFAAALTATGAIKRGAKEEISRCARHPVKVERRRHRGTE